MILDTGLLCPSYFTMNLFPFGISDNYLELYNVSGWNGPVQTGINTTPNARSFSGIIGDGTFYPAAAKLDQLSRMFWCVKGWEMKVSFSRSMLADSVDCINPLFDPLAPFLPQFMPSFQYCIIGGYGGDPNSLYSNDVITKELPLQDYCAAHHADYNLNRTGVCPVNESNPNNNTCVPINPIQTFQDLLTRDEYFTWSPSEAEVAQFETGKSISGLSGPYFDDWFQFAVLNPDPAALGYDCGQLPTVEGVKSYFSLSIMNLDGLAYSGISKFYKSGHYPELSTQALPFEKYGVSGESLTNKWGEITGYGINKKPYEVYSPLVFDIGTGINHPGFNNPDTSNSFYPFIHFQMRFKNTATVNRLCPTNEVISSALYTGVGLTKVGQLTIIDTLLTNNTKTGLEAGTVLSLPLYGRRNFNFEFIDVQLSPASFWVDTSGKATY